VIASAVTGSRLSVGSSSTSTGGSASSALDGRMELAAGLLVLLLAPEVYAPGTVALPVSTARAGRSRRPTA